MERLTEKTEAGYDLKTYKPSILSPVINKLGQIEDAEEKMGIDFITIFKALTNDIRVFDDGYPYTAWVDLIYSSGIPCGFKCRVSDHCVYFKDFGKTWTLTTKRN